MAAARRRSSAFSSASSRRTGAGSPSSRTAARFRARASATSPTARPSRPPPLLVLDEPDTALDAEGLATLRRLVAEEIAAGRTVVYVTHDSDAMGGADAVFHVDGRVSVGFAAHVHGAAP